MKRWSVPIIWYFFSGFSFRQRVRESPPAAAAAQLCRLQSLQRGGEHKMWFSALIRLWSEVSKRNKRQLEWPREKKKKKIQTLSQIVSIFHSSSFCLHLRRCAVNASSRSCLSNIWGTNELKGHDSSARESASERTHQGFVPDSFSLSLFDLIHSLSFTCLSWQWLFHFVFYLYADTRHNNLRYFETSFSHRK